MKNLILITLISLLSIPANAATEQDLLKCRHVGILLATPSYVFTVDRAEGAGREKFYLKKVFLNPTAAPLAVEMPRPLIYGNTWITTKNQGRSGNSHIYSNGNVAVIDINLFQARETGINTNGAVTDYVCQLAN